MNRLVNWLRRRVTKQQGKAGDKPSRTPSLPIGDEAMTLIRELRSSKLTYCGAPKLENIAGAIDVLKSSGVHGAYLEAGVALGGSAILLGKLRPADVTLHLYDVFAMIPPPGENDGPDAHARYEEIKSGQSKGLGDDAYYGYIDDLQSLVERNLTSFDLKIGPGAIELHKGLFEDALYPTEPVALAHIDCDWYDSVKVCIDRILPNLVSGGVVIFDDYASYSGCRRAVDELMLPREDLVVLFQNRSIAFRKR